MTTPTLKTSLELKKLSDTLLRLTKDIDAVIGVQALTATSAEIWLSSPDAEDDVRNRCASVFRSADDDDDAQNPLPHVTLTFRHDLQRADAQGRAAERPRSTETSSNDNLAEPFTEEPFFPFGPSPEVE